MSLENSISALADAVLSLASALQAQGSPKKEASAPLTPSADAPLTPSADAPLTPSADAPRPRGRPRKTESPVYEVPASEGKTQEAEPAESSVTIDDVRAKLLQVKELYGDKTVALQVLNDFGYQKLDQVQEKDIKRLLDKAESVIDAYSPDESF